MSLVNDNFLKMPRKGDKWIMQLFTRAGFKKEDLLRLNRVRVHQQVLFLSCVLGASGKSLDKKYMTKRKAEEKWSMLRFPKEKPPNKDFQLWRMALRQIVPAVGIPDRLGRLTDNGYKICNWRWYLERGRLIHFKGEVMDVYRPSSLPRMVNAVNRWTRTRIGQETDQGGQVCTIREVELAVVAVVSNMYPQPGPPDPNSTHLTTLLWLLPNPCHVPPVDDVDHSRETRGPIDIHNLSFEVDQALPF